MAGATPVRGGDPRQPIPRRRWRWFLAGFSIVFAGLLLVYPAEFYDGHAVYLTKLWHYYLLAIRQQWNSSGFAGPTSGNLAVLLRTVFLHVSVAALGGVGALALARVLRLGLPR
jgi:hypothetical protein